MVRYANPIYSRVLTVVPARFDSMHVLEGLKVHISSTLRCKIYQSISLNEANHTIEQLHKLMMFYMHEVSSLCLLFSGNRGVTKVSSASE